MATTNMASNIAKNGGIFMKSITFYKGGPNLLSVSTKDDNRIQGSQSISPQDEMWQIGNAIGRQRAFRQNNEDFLLQQPFLHVSPRFTNSPGLIKLHDLKEHGWNTNPFVFNHPATTRYNKVD